MACVCRRSNDTSGLHIGNTGRGQDEIRRSYGRAILDRIRPIQGDCDERGIFCRRLGPPAWIALRKNYYKRQDAQGKEYTASDFSLLLRTRSGVIREIERVPNRLRFKAMPDGNALAVQYSVPHKPDEILIINTETGKKKHLAYGRPEYYDAKGGGFSSPSIKREIQA